MKADWDHLKVVLAVSRAGSLSGAAMQLSMDQTTAGRRLTALEDQLGTALFHRSKAGFLATEAGQVVIESAAQVETRLETMMDDVLETQDGAVGMIRIMGNTWMLQRLAENFLPELLSHNPRLEVRLSGRLPPTPLYSEPTISLWFDAPAVGDDKAIPFLSVPYASYASENASTGWAQFLDDQARGPSFANQIKKRIRDDGAVRLTATDAQILQGALRGGMGKGYLPVCLGEDDEKLHRVAEQPEISRVLHLHLNAGAYRTKRAQIVIEALFDQGAELLAGKRLLKSSKLSL